MSKQSIKKWSLLLTFWLALHTAALRAQTLPISYSGTSSSFGVDTYGLLSATGTYGGTDSLSLSGAGTRMFWDPYKAAFRAGRVSGTQWDDANIGAYSTASGYNTKASGNYSTAMGSYSTASGSNSTAMGNSTATGPYSTAMGASTTASGGDSMAMGILTMASGMGSMAMGGVGTTASGLYSIAMGGITQASGNYSTAMGSGSRASGSYSMAAGYDVTAGAYQACAVGAFNVNLNADGTSTPNATTWVATDPLFEVGNGYQLQVSPYTITHSDALVVYKNGVVAVHNTVRFNAGGDLSMGGFTAGTAP